MATGSPFFEKFSMRGLEDRLYDNLKVLAEHNLAPDIDSRVRGPFRESESRSIGDAQVIRETIENEHKLYRDKCYKDKPDRVFCLPDLRQRQLTSDNVLVEQLTTISLDNFDEDFERHLSTAFHDAIGHSFNMKTDAPTAFGLKNITMPDVPTFEKARGASAVIARQKLSTFEIQFRHSSQHATLFAYELIEEMATWVYANVLVMNPNIIGSQESRAANAELSIIQYYTKQIVRLFQTFSASQSQTLTNFHTTWADKNKRSFTQDSINYQVAHRAAYMFVGYESMKLHRNRSYDPEEQF